MLGLAGRNVERRLDNRSLPTQSCYLILFVVIKWPPSTCIPLLSALISGNYSYFCNVGWRKSSLVLCQRIETVLVASREWWTQVSSWTTLFRNSRESRHGYRAKHNE